MKWGNHCRLFVAVVQQIYVGQVVQYNIIFLSKISDSSVINGKIRNWRTYIP